MARINLHNDNMDVKKISKDYGLVIDKLDDKENRRKQRKRLKKGKHSKRRKGRKQ